MLPLEQVEAIRAAREQAMLVTGAAFGVGGGSWNVTHADGTTGTLNGYVVARQGPMGEEYPNVATPGEQSIRSWEFRAASGADVRPQDVLQSGSLRFIVLDVPPVAGGLRAPLQRLEFFYLAELWRINPATGRRVSLKEADGVTLRRVAVSIFPGGAQNFTDMETGQVGGRESYTGNTELNTDVRENDQFRNIVDRAGMAWFSGARLTVTTVARHPAILLLRMRNEGA